MSKTANINVAIPFDEEKITTLNVYLKQQNQSLETILADVLREGIEKTYVKVVPAAVQNYIALKNGALSSKGDKKKPKPPSKDTKGKTIGDQELVQSIKEDELNKAVKL